MSEGRPSEDSSSAESASRRPASIGELAERATQYEWDDSRDLKHCLRLAESARNRAKAYHSAGDLESAFVFYARAATIALEKLPAHPQYRSVLRDAQRDNLGLNGQDILDLMSGLKPVLVDRFNKWRAAHPEATLLPLSDSQDSPMTAADFSKALKDEAAAWRQWREKYETQAQQERQRQIRPQSQRQPPLDRRKHDSIRHSPVPSVADHAFVQPPSYGHGSSSTKIVVMQPVNSEVSQRKTQAEQGILRRQQEAEADARQIRQKIAVNNALPRGHHQQGSLSAHSSLSSVNSMFPHTQTSPLATTPTSSYHRAPPQLSTSSQPTIYPLHLQSVVPTPVVTPAQQPPPLQNPLTPVRARNATPSPVLTPISRQPTPSHSRAESPVPHYLFPGSSSTNLHRTPTRASIRSQGSQNFFSTTSPPPRDAQTLFPSLMSLHQQQQGYYPSHYSISMSMDRLKLNHTTDTSPSTSLYNPNIGIHAPSGNPPPPWMFGSQESMKSAAAVATAAPSAQGIVDGGVKSRNPGTMTYQNPLPPPPGMGVDNGPMSPGSVPYIPMPPPPPNSSSASQALSANRRIPPPLPAPPVYSQSQSQHHSNQRQEQRQEQHQHREKHHPSSMGKKLKTVVLPREVLPRFLAIASLNTNANIETCGLLLGNEVWVNGSVEHGRRHDESRNNERENVGEGMKRKSEYVVTTLLIPKQRATSDTCTMDGEELVLEFVDQRSLITLGWIHTHPSQSCFMSSVDLHTHSGFQKMLPESVAVVCAPKSKPNFGVFRLTDPPGLSTILECKEKEAFHPHPDLPIYTDADKGHVQMRDSALEIIDMR